MKEILIPSGVPPRERLALMPQPLLNAVLHISANYDLQNDTREMCFDRKFEELNPSARVLYKPDRVVWEDDRDYTLFCLRWS